MMEEVKKIKKEIGLSSHIFWGALLIIPIINAVAQNNFKHLPIILGVDILIGFTLMGLINLYIKNKLRKLHKNE